MDNQEWHFIEKLFERYRITMLHRAKGYVNNEQDAEDIVSDVWLSMIKHLPQLFLMEEKARSSYLMESVQNRAINYLRNEKNRQKKRERLEQEIRAQTQTEAIGYRITREALHKSIQSLPSREKVVVQMRISGLNNSQIAEILEITPSSVRVYLSRARIKMQRTLDSIEQK